MTLRRSSLARPGATAWSRPHVNLHRGLCHGDLRRRYVRGRTCALVEPADPKVEDYDEDEDDLDLEFDPWYHLRENVPTLERMCETVWADGFGTPLMSVAHALTQAGVAVTAPAPLPHAREDLATALPRVLFALDPLAVPPMPELTASQRLAFAAIVRDCDATLPRVTEDDLDRLEWHKCVVLTLAYLSPFFVRPVESWPRLPVGDDQWIRSLVGHLLVSYEVPPCLYRPWMAQGSRFCVDFPAEQAVALLILFGQGVSIRDVAPEHGLRLRSAKAVAALFDAPADLNWERAVLWAEVKAAGGTLEAFVALDETRFEWMMARDRPGRAPAPLSLLVDTVRWLSTRGAVLGAEEKRLALHWAEHMVRWNRTFSWRGRTAAATRARALAFRREQARERELAAGLRSWRSHGWDCVIHRDARTWAFRELTSGTALVAEGEAMVNCAESYLTDCFEGQSALFTVERDGVRALMVQVRPWERSVVQVKGPRNAAPSAEELDAVAEWERMVLRGGA